MSFAISRRNIPSAFKKNAKIIQVRRVSEANAEDDESYLFDTLETINLRLDKLESGGGTTIIKTTVNQLILVVNQIKQYFGILWVIVYFVVNWILGINASGALSVLQTAGMDSAMTLGQFSGFSNLTDFLM